MFYTWVMSPLGRLLMTSNERSLNGLYMADSEHKITIGLGWIENANALPFPQSKQQLAEYFKGERKTFDLPVTMVGTDFQLRVWQALLEIPFATTISYTQLAHQIGNPTGIRAVGQANGRNPIAIIIPCHRVVGANGSLTGYGGGIERKAALLEFEKAVEIYGPQHMRSKLSKLSGSAGL